MWFDGASIAGGNRVQAVQGALARSPAQVALRLANRRRLGVLAYHAVTDAAAFARQLDWLQEHASVIGLDALLRWRTDPLPRHPVLLTFDDGDRSVLDVAAPLLHERGLPAVAFVVAGLVDTDEPFWWVEVAQLGRRLGHPAVELRRAVLRLKQVPDQQRRQALADLRRRAGRLRTPQLTSEELRRLEASGVRVGNHSWSHACLDRCDDRSLRHEVQAAHRRLEEVLGHRPVAFAYPNGNHDERVVRCVRAAGYEVGFIFDHRLAEPTGDLLLTSRIRLDADAGIDRLRIMVSGLHPAIHRMRGRT